MQGVTSSTQSWVQLPFCQGSYLACEIGSLPFNALTSLQPGKAAHGELDACARSRLVDGRLHGVRAQDGSLQELRNMPWRSPRR